MPSQCTAHGNIVVIYSATSANTVRQCAAIHLEKIDNNVRPHKQTQWINDFGAGPEVSIGSHDAHTHDRPIASRCKPPRTQQTAVP